MNNLFKLLQLSFLVVLCISNVLSGCAFRDLKREIAESEKLQTLGGEIAVPSPSKAGVIVLLYSQTEEMNELVSYTIAADTGHFSFLVPQGTYFLAAFQDLNKNLSCDKGEPVGYYGAPDMIVLQSKERSAKGENNYLDLDFRLAHTDRLAAGFSSTIDAQKIAKSDFVKFGQIASLDDEIFAQENGSTGYWKPLTFLRDFGIGVYFLEPYDPDKIPVLFVHGAVGTPGAYHKIVEKMDRDRFQPWFYYYPSGIELDDAASALNEIIKRIHAAYEFKTLYVTAQSMGGLVARSFIMRNIYADRQNYIKLFVSISTPWNGHRLTARGVEAAPAAIPSWHDMVPESEFIKSIYRHKFPAYLKFYLLFSYRGDCSLMLENNDGTVELSSELDYRPQKEAARVFGFDEDHGSIVFSPKFIEYYHGILNED